jgi:Protein of unknown function (DUF3238)
MDLQSVTFWLNAFIPNSVCSLKGSLFAVEVPDPGINSGGGVGLTRLFTGDQREFSDDPNASARMHSEVTIAGLSSGSPTFSQRQVCGESHEVDSDGNIIGTATAPTDRMQFSNLRGSQTTDPEGGVVDGVPGSVQIDLAGSAAIPLMAVAPDIDYSGTLVIDLSEGNVIFTGAISGFPGFEMYFKVNDGPSVTLGQFAPVSPIDLIGDENRPVNVSARIVV